MDDVGIEDVTAEGISLYAGGNSSCSSGNSNITIQNSRVVRTGQDIVGMKGISQTLGDGIFGKGTEAASILYNYVEDTQRDGITISPSGSCQSNNWIIRGNIINNACNNPRDEECAGIATKQHSVAGSSTSTGHIIENNLIYGLSGRSGATGIRGMRQTGWDNAFGNNIWRYNTVVTDGATGYGLHIDGASGVQPSDVIGNLFVANGSQTTLYSGTGANVGTTAYNTYWTPGSNDQVYNVGGTTATRATITSSIEPTAIQTAPIFDTGYELASNSPQVDAGNTQCQGDDWIGTPRPVDTDCDVGGFEYATLAAPEIPAGLNVVVTP